MILDFEKIKSVHFIGIGGIGISAIARMMFMNGKEVSGSDRSSSIITDELKKIGVHVSIGHNLDNIPQNCDMVIYTIAIPEDNPELLGAKKGKILTLTYPEILGLISKDKFTIAISGTHGKTTTTAMIGKMMVDAGLDPTVIVGSLMNSSTTLTTSDNRSNIIVGKSRYFVVEACEYKRSFLNLSPKIIIVTNIDDDHLDYYADLQGVQKGFSDFVSKLGPEDFLVTNLKDKNVLPILSQVRSKIIDYSLLGLLGSSTPKLKLRVIGGHNLENAKVALALAKILGIDQQLAINSLNSFSGTWRRFEYKGQTRSGVVVYDDYAHHPTEVRATLQGARDFFGDKKRIVTIFQPHLYSRTRSLLKDFGRSFSNTDELILLPIYAAREKEDLDISSDLLADEIVKNIGTENGHLKKATVVKNKEEAVSLVQASLHPDVIITMGAGDVTTISDTLTR